MSDRSDKALAICISRMEERGVPVPFWAYLDDEDIAVMAEDDAGSEGVCG